VAGVGTQATGAAGAITSLGATVLTVLGRLAAGVGLILAGWEVGKYLGQKVSDWTGRTEMLNNTQDLAAERARVLGDASFNKIYRGWSTERQKSYWSSNRGIHYDTPDSGNQIARFTGVQSSGIDMRGNAIPAARPTERIEVVHNI